MDFSRIKLYLLKFTAKARTLIDRYSVPVLIFGVIIFIGYYTNTLHPAEKINGLVSISALFFIMIAVIIRGIINSGNKHPVPDHIDSFFKKAFDRIMLLNSSQIRFANKKELKEIAVMIQENASFKEQFGGDYRPRLALYAKWNELTSNKAVAQVFSKDGQTLIGASIILPLNEIGFRMLTTAEPGDQLRVLTELTPAEIEWRNFYNTYFLIDILIIDKTALKVFRRKYSHRLNVYEDYILGLSLHATLWHLAALSNQRIHKLPCILVQPDVFGMLKWAHNDAGLVLPDDPQKKAKIGDYIVINQDIYQQYQKEEDKERLYIISQSLRLLQSYFMEHFSNTKINKMNNAEGG